ncbi:unnamed protein product [Rhizophagus irregularis]|nr:unnamed protein product [Rhizophagus irregularis]
MQYTDQKSSPFDDIIFSGSEKEGTNESVVPWKWLENHTRMCQYSLDIKKYKDSSCCSPKRNEEAAFFLQKMMEYCNKLKIPGYDAHCPSINANTYSRLCCPKCNAYFPTLSIVTQHKKNHHPK